MENTPTIPDTTDSGKNILIIILIVILVLSLLGINLFIIFGNGLQKLIDIFSPIVSKTLSNLGYASGTLLDKSTDVVADASKYGIDIAHDTLDSVGELLVRASGKGSQTNTINLNQGPLFSNNAEPDQSASAIQGPRNKQNWCLVGEHGGSRGCVAIDSQDKCMSGQVFPSQHACMNPTRTQN